MKSNEEFKKPLKNVEVRFGAVGVGIIISIVSAGVGIYSVYSDSQNTASTAAITCTFEKGDTIPDYKEDPLLEPSKGFIYYEWKQTQGKAGCPDGTRYSLSYKKVTDSKYTNSGSFMATNNTAGWNAETFLLCSNGHRDYNIKISKKNNSNTASKAHVKFYFKDYAPAISTK